MATSDTDWAPANQSVWEPPGSLADLRDYPLVKGGCGNWEVVFDFPGGSTGLREITLEFSGVLDMRHTHDLVKTTNTFPVSAYGRLVCLGNTRWLQETLDKSPISTIEAGFKIELEKMRHLAISFDEGPCIEFICSGFSYREVEKEQE